MKALCFLFVIAAALSSTLLNAAPLAADKDKAVIEKYQKALEEARGNKAVAEYLKQEVFVSVIELMKYIAQDTFIKPDAADKKDDEKYNAMKGRPSNPDELYEKYGDELTILYPRWKSLRIEDITKQAEKNLQEAERKLAFLESNDIVKKYLKENPAEDDIPSNAKAAELTRLCVREVINGKFEEAEREKNKKDKYERKRENSRVRAEEYNAKKELQRKKAENQMKVENFYVPQNQHPNQ